MYLTQRTKENVVKKTCEIDAFGLIKKNSSERVERAVGKIDASSMHAHFAKSCNPRSLDLLPLIIFMLALQLYPLGILLLFVKAKRVCVRETRRTRAHTKNEHFQVNSMKKAQLRKVFFSFLFEQMSNLERFSIKKMGQKNSCLK